MDSKAYEEGLKTDEGKLKIEKITALESVAKALKKDAVISMIISAFEALFTGFFAYECWNSNIKVSARVLCGLLGIYWIVKSLKNISGSRDMFVFSRACMESAKELEDEILNKENK